MYAVIKTGGKQYRVEQGDIIQVEKLDAEPGALVTFDVLLLGGETVTVGKPVVAGTAVTGKVVEHGKGAKVIIFKMKSKKDSRKKQGHRQPFTTVEITAIG